MRYFIAVVFFAILASASSFASVTAPVGYTGGLFNVLGPSGTSFKPSSSTMANFLNWPTTSYLAADGVSTTTVLQTGWQQGDYLANGKVLFIPYNTQTGGGFLGQNTQIPHGIVFSYANGATGTGFTTSTNWSYFDLTSIPFTPPAGLTTANDAARCYVGEDNPGCDKLFCSLRRNEFSTSFCRLQYRASDNKQLFLYTFPGNGSRNYEH